MTTVLFTLLLPLIWFAFWTVVIGNFLVQQNRPRWWSIPLSVFGPLGALIILATRRAKKDQPDWLPS